MPSQRDMQTVKLLAGAYLAISAVTVVVIVALRNHTGAVDDTVWNRGIVVLASSVLMLAFVRRAAGGSRRALTRVRIVSAVMMVAIAVTVAVPGLLPLWMKLEQIACGLVLLAVAAIVIREPLRTACGR